MNKEARYAELKKKVADKGYMGVEEKERKEYSELKKEIEADGNKVDFGVTKVEEKKEEPVKEEKKDVEVKKGGNIEVTPAALQQMINDGIENYRKNQKSMPEDKGEWKEVDKTKGANQTATLRLYQKDSKSPYGAVIRADYLKTVWDEETHKHDKMLYEVEVLYEDGESEVFEMVAEDYCRLNQTENVELIKNDRKELRQVSGKIGIPMRDADGYPVYKMNSGGYGSMKGVVGETELEVIRFDETFTVKRPNGQTFEIHSRYLNG